MQLILGDLNPFCFGSSGALQTLDERPRKTLNYETPAERFSQCVAATS